MSTAASVVLPAPSAPPPACWQPMPLVERCGASAALPAVPLDVAAQIVCKLPRELRDLLPRKRVALASTMWTKSPADHPARPLGCGDLNPAETELQCQLESGELDTLGEIQQEEFWEPLFASSERAAEIDLRYSTGLFSPGRPGRFVSENDDTLDVSIRSRYRSARNRRVAEYRGQRLADDVESWLLDPNSPETKDAYRHAVAACLKACARIHFVPLFPGRSKLEFVEDWIADWAAKYWAIAGKPARKRKIKKDASTFRSIPNECKRDLQDESRKSRAAKRDWRKTVSLDKEIRQKADEDPVPLREILEDMRLAARLSSLQSRLQLEERTKQAIKDLRQSNPKRARILQAVLNCLRTDERPDVAVARALGVSQPWARKILKKLCDEAHFPAGKTIR